MVDKIHAKAKVIWLVGTKHASDKQYTSLHRRWYWNKKECAAYCKHANNLNQQDSNIPMKFVYAGDLPSTYK